MSYLKNANIGRRRKPKKMGGRRAPSRNLRAPSGGAPVHNDPAVLQKIIDMGFSLGDNVPFSSRPDTESYFKFLTSLADAGFGQGNAVQAASLEPGGGLSWWMSMNHARPIVTPPPLKVESATDALWEYTNPQNWKLGNQADGTSSIMFETVPYRMQDLLAWYTERLTHCKGNPCLELTYKNRDPDYREMPWSYVGTVQPGGRLQLRNRREMIKFLGEYAKYWLNDMNPLFPTKSGLQQPTPTGRHSFGGKTPCPIYYCPEGYTCKKGTNPLDDDKCVKATANMSAPRPHPTSRLNPLQRKLQANPFRQEKQTMSYLENARRYSFGANPCGGCPPGTKCVQLQHPLTGVTWWECKEPRHVESPLPDPFGESRGGGSGTLIAPSGRSTRGLNPLQRKLQANTFRPKRNRR